MLITYLKPNRPEFRAGWGWSLFVFFTAIVLTLSTVPVGSQTGQPAISISLAAAPTPSNPTLIGASADDHLSGNGTPDSFSAFPRAHAVAVGDFNHDGFQDVVVGAPDADITPAAPAAPRPGAGAVYVIFGKPTFAANTTIDANPAAQSQPDIRILGANADDATGFAVAMGDVNGDGNDDLIIGAPGFDSSTGAPPVQHQNAGAVYVLFGGMTQTARTIDLATVNAANLLITGENAGDQFGSALAVGDVNGGQDTTADLLVGAPNSVGPAPATPRVNGGAVFLFQGGTGLANANANTRVIDLATNPTPATVRAYGKAGSLFGAALAIGDINSQGAADMIVGAPQSARPDQGGDVAGTGAVYVLFGGSNIAPQPPATSLTIDLAQPTLATLRLVVYGATANDHLGASVAAGNIRGSGVIDLVMGAPDADGPGESRVAAGEVYVLAGGTNLNPADQTTERRIDVTLGTMNLTIFGATVNDHLGETVAVSRINTQGNTDSIADLLMGAPGFAQDEGAVYALYGGQNLFFLATRDLALFGQSDLTITGEAAGDELGWAIAAGDLDNNRGGDLVLGAPFANVTGRTDAGKVYVLLAAAQNVPPVNQNPIVAVTKPNGGETALGGLPFNINWTASDPDGDNTIDHFNILLSTNSGTSFNVLVANNVAGNLRTFTWNVPSGLNTTTARIRITAFDTAGGTAQDDSDGNFTIIDAGIGVTLTAPNGGEVLKPGDVFKITWTVPDGLADQVRGFDLFLSTDSGQNFNIPITAVNPTQPALPGTAREFDWTVGNFCTRTARVLVRATSVTGAVSTDASNGDFSIANAGPTVDLGNEAIFFTASNILAFRTTTINGQEVRFVSGLTVEISTDETGTTFVQPTKLKLKKSGQRLLIKGTTNGALISTFWPDNAIRIVRITNPNCGLTILRLKRVGNFIVAAPAFDGAATHRIQ